VRLRDGLLFAQPPAVNIRNSQQWAAGFGSANIDLCDERAQAADPSFHIPPSRGEFSINEDQVAHAVGVAAPADAPGEVGASGGVNQHTMIVSVLLDNLRNDVVWHGLLLPVSGHVCALVVSGMDGSEPDPRSGHRRDLQGTVGLGVPGVDASLVHRRIKERSGVGGLDGEVLPRRKL